MAYNLLIRLILAHLLSDFVLQPTKWAKEKDNNGFSSGYLYLHVLVTGIIAMILVSDINWLLPIGLITAIHGLTDGIKGEINKRFLEKSPLLKPSFRKSFLYKRFFKRISSLSLFVADQFIHLLTIGTIVILATNQSGIFNDELTLLLQSQKFWLYLLGYTWSTIPTAVLIGKITEGWSNTLIDAQSSTTTQSALDKKEKSGLKNAGKWIGIIERILILTFVLNLQFAAIGFMLTAKSVFRFGDLKDGKDHQKTEYIIIGTFLSFMLSILTGIVLNYLTR